MISENKLFPFFPMVLSFYPKPLGAYFLVQQLSMPLSLGCNVPVCSLGHTQQALWNAPPCQMSDNPPSRPPHLTLLVGTL